MPVDLKAIRSDLACDFPNDVPKPTPGMDPESEFAYAASTARSYELAKDAIWALLDHIETMEPRWRDGEPPHPPPNEDAQVWREDPHACPRVVTIVAQGRGDDLELGYIKNGQWFRWKTARWRPVL